MSQFGVIDFKYSKNEHKSDYFAWYKVLEFTFALEWAQSGQ